ncbi:MAG: DNA-binding protein WhiA [Microbacteriaceae bacterium]|jgi:DNA-binding protein WhiA|nr:DNA-binding protein WhiA [Microbacteriaceae bacterium]MCI1206725.1 DNA-binding protein WhiA [Microbacteriaceae bacterium]
MSLNEQLMQELLGMVYSRGRSRAAELATILRLTGGLHTVSGRLILEIELESPRLVARVRKALRQLYNAESDLVSVGAQPAPLVRVLRGGETLARQTGLIDVRNRPLRGLVPALVHGSPEISRAVWRGALLARGSLGEPGRTAALEVSCPNGEIAMAMVGSARRLGVPVKSKEVRGQHRASIRDPEDISAMLGAIGAVETQETWDRLRHRKEVRASVNRLVNFDDANLRRSAQAAVTASARVGRALEILGDDIPEHLRSAGALRLEHRQASLDELGRLADPPLTKDAVAGRIRRLLALADKRAAEQGVPDTRSVLSEEVD